MSIRRWLVWLCAVCGSCLLGAQEESSEVINIENPAVRDYLKDDTYFRDSCFDTTVVFRYAKASVYGSEGVQPWGKSITWRPTLPADSLSGFLITVSTWPDDYEQYTYFPSLTARTFTVRNLLPGEYYSYRVEQLRRSGEVDLLAQGFFRTLGHLRMLSISGVRNVRDLGGWPTMLVPDGRLKYGILYRGAHLDKITPEGIHDMRDNLLIGAELDLRAESAWRHSAIDSTVSFARIVTDSYSPQGQGPSYLQDLRWIIQQLQDGRIVYWHCGVGCDRCGTLSFLIEGLLGLNEIDLCRDYELSCFAGFNRPRSHQDFRRLIPWIKQHYPAPSLAESFYNYWLALGMTPEELDYLRMVMIDGYSPDNK